MNADRLLEHFERISEAPDAVARLRRFVLDLAVRGELVEQDPEDEPAAVLLERIEAARVNLKGTKKTGKEADLAKITPNEIPIGVPEHWEWVRLCALGDLGGGMTPSKSRSEYWDGEINWFSPKDIKSDEIRESALRITSAGLNETRLRLYSPGCLFMVARSGILKRTFPVAINRAEGASNQDMKVLVPYLGGLERYLQIMFQGMMDFILSDLVKQGTTVQSLKYQEFEQQPFPLPPLAEQHRIVAKVDELMALCDDLEAAQTTRENRRDRLVAATLHHLNNPGTDSEATFKETAGFYFNHLPRLTTKPEHIQQLRQTILNLAVRGKLVGQDPGDEPASGLLATIEAKMKEQLAAGQIRKLKTRKAFANAEVPFKCPQSWQWATLQSVGITQTGTTPPRTRPEFFGKYVPFVKPADLTHAEIEYDGEGISSAGLSHSRLIKAGSVLMVCIGSSIGKVNRTDRDICCNQQINAVTPFVADCGGFLQTALKADSFQRLVAANAGTGTLPIISKGKWEQLVIPLPPLPEQHRIVAKVDELTALCDGLESQRTMSATIRAQVLEAVLQEALDNAERHGL